VGAFGFAGKFGYQEDSDSSLKLLGHRYYDPSTGRFLTRNPTKDGRNWYVYCASNPCRFVDPSGRWLVSQTVMQIAEIVRLAVSMIFGDMKEGIILSGRGTLKQPVVSQPANPRSPGTEPTPPKPPGGGGLRPPSSGLGPPSKSGNPVAYYAFQVVFSQDDMGRLGKGGGSGVSSNGFDWDVLGKSVVAAPLLVATFITIPEVDEEVGEDLAASEAADPVATNEAIEQLLEKIAA
jgi:RHS repeat-associated protein